MILRRLRRASRRITRSGSEHAVQIARAHGIHLIAAKVDKVDEEYFREKIAPLLRARRRVNGDQRTDKDRLSGPGARLLSLSIAGALRLGHDRVMAWYADTGVPPRSCFRDHRQWRHRRNRRHGGRSRRGLAASPFTRSPRGSATLRATILFGAHGQGICRALPLFACSAIHAGMRAGRAILNANRRKVD